MVPPRKKVWKAWIPSVVWLILIAVESTSLLSASNTSLILYPVVHYLFGVDQAHFPFWNYLIRKIGHFVGYFVLSLLLFHAWRATVPLRRFTRWAGRWALVAFFMSASVASLDEWHQTHLASRTGTIHDVGLDSMAALAAQLMLIVLSTIPRRSKPDLANSVTVE